MIIVFFMFFFIVEQKMSTVSMYFIRSLIKRNGKEIESSLESVVLGVTCSLKELGQITNTYPS